MGQALPFLSYLLRGGLPGQPGGSGGKPLIMGLGLLARQGGQARDTGWLCRSLPA